MIRRTLSVRVLAATMVAAVVAGGLIYAIHHWQVARTARALLVHGERHEAQQEWLKAAEYFDRYLRLLPADRAVPVRLAEAYGQGAVTLAQKQQAVALFYRALGTGPTERESILRLRMAELLVEIGRFSAGEQEARKILAASPDEARAHRALALALWNQIADGSLAGQRTKELGVSRAIIRAQGLNPSDAELASITAAMYRQRAPVVSAEFPELSAPDLQSRANARLDQLVEKAPQDHKAWLARHLYRVQHQLAGADEDLRRALAIAPDDAATVMTAAGDAFRRADEQERSSGANAARPLYAEARQHYERLASLKSAPRVAAWQLGLAESCLRLGDLDAALVNWRRGLKLFEQPTVQAAFHARIADTLLERQRLDDARLSLEALDRIVEKLDGSVPRDERLAITQAHDLRRANWRLLRSEPVEAIPLLLKVIPQLSRAEAQGDAAYRTWSLLGLAYSQVGDWAESAAAYQRAANIKPALAAPRTAAARAALMAGQAELASERAEESLTVEPTHGAWWVLALSQLQVQSLLPAEQQSWSRFDQALAAVEKGLNEKVLDESAGDLGWRAAILHVDQLLARSRTTSAEPQSRIEAAAMLRAAEGRFASVVEFRSQLVHYYEQLGLPAEADRALAELRTIPQASIAAAIAAARLATSRGKHDDALAELNRAAQQASPAEQNRLRGELVVAAVAKQDYALARTVLKEQHQQSPADLPLLRRLAELELESQNFAGLANCEERLTRFGPAGQVLAGYYRACRLLFTARPNDTKQLREALAEQGRIAALRPLWPQVISLGGMIEQQLGRPEQAVAAYERAIQLGEQRLAVFEQLLALLDQLNRPADSQRYLERLAAQLPRSQRLTELAASHQVKSEHPAQALDTARLGVQRRPQDAPARIWLGRLLLINNLSAEAKAEFERAIELSPTDVRTWNAMFSLHLRSGDQPQARQVLGQLVDKVKLEPAERSFVLAQGYELLGDFAEAEKHYREAARASPDSVVVLLRMAGMFLRTNPPEAEVCLRSALRLDGKSVVARRMLAILLAARGGDEHAREVESLLDSTDDNQQVVTEDRRLQALLLAQRGGAANLNRAVKLLEELVDRSTGSTPNDRLILAHFYETQGRTSADPKIVDAKLDAARQQFLLVATRQQADASQISALAAFLLRHERGAEADLWLNRLEEVLNQAPRTRPEAIAQLVQLSLDHGSHARCGPWLDRLAKIEESPLRLLSLRAQWLAATDPMADWESQIDLQAVQLVADAKDPAESRRILREVGAIYELVNRHSAAERWYRKLLADDPKQYAYVAGSLGKQGRIPDALALCEESANTDATSQPAIVAAAVLVENKPSPADFRRAEPLVAAALRQFDADARLHYAAGVLRVIQGRYDESIELFRKVLEIEPRNSDALNNLALLMAEDPARRGEALALIDRAIDISGTQAGLLDTKGAILVYDGQSAQAVTLLEAAARSASGDPRHSFHLAAAYRDVGETAKAKVELRTALDNQLELQMLTPTDRRLLVDLKAALSP